MALLDLVLVDVVAVAVVVLFLLILIIRRTLTRRFGACRTKTNAPDKKWTACERNMPGTFARSRHRTLGHQAMEWAKRVVPMVVIGDTGILALATVVEMATTMIALVVVVAAADGQAVATRRPR